MIDVTGEINAVSRTVGSRTLEAGEARIVTVGRTYAAALDEVWDACTNPERIPRWFMPVSGDLREGGRYDLEGNASGTIERCDPPRGFDATWEFGGQVSWIEVRLTAEDAERTRFELEHIAHVEDEFWDRFGPGAVGIGWDLGVLGLALHLASGEPVDRDAVNAWMASEDGVRYVTLASEGWREASVAAGTPEKDARDAADRSTAFYTGAEA
jgi:uncharacterized protein YndB with AHSA1/START domain